MHSTQNAVQYSAMTATFEKACFRRKQCGRRVVYVTRHTFGAVHAWKSLPRTWVRHQTAGQLAPLCASRVPLFQASYLFQEPYI